MSRGFKDIKKQDCNKKKDITRQSSYQYLIKVESNGDEHSRKAKSKFKTPAYSTIKKEVKNDQR